MNQIRWAAILSGLIALIAIATLGTAWATKKSLSASAPEAASLQLSATTIDIGKVTAGEWIVIDFAVRNQGQRRVVINQFDEQCGCTNPVRRTMLVPPGASYDIPIVVDTTSTSGHVRQVTSFTTNDPAHPKFSVTILAVVR